jgi:hypothetical protein
MGPTKIIKALDNQLFQELQIVKDIMRRKLSLSPFMIILMRPFVLVFFTLFDLNGVRITRAIGRVTDTGRISRLSTTLDTMLDLAKRNPAVAKVMTIGKRLGDATLGKLLNRLADMKQSVRQKFLENLGDLTEEQIKNILNRVTKCAT